MSEQTSTAVATTPHTCGQSTESHIRTILEMMLLTGMGGGCFDSYRALMDVAAAFKERNDYPDYVPNAARAEAEIEKLDREIEEAKHIGQLPAASFKQAD